MRYQMQVQAFQLLILALAAVSWLMLLRSWKSWLKARLDARVAAALAGGDRPEPVTGLSNYEQAEVADAMFRAAQARPWERVASILVAFGVPAVFAILAMFG